MRSRLRPRQRPRRRWRGSTMRTLKRHPLSADLPAMPAGEFAALVDDIKAHGQRVPVTVFEGQVLDGWHRYRACVELGLSPTLEKFTGTVKKAAAFVVSLNVRRRHLDTGQIAVFTAEHLLPHLEAVARKRQGRKKNIREADLCVPGHTSRRVAGQRAAADAAKTVGISPSSVARAKRVLTHGTGAEIAALRNGSRPLRRIAEAVQERTQKLKTNVRKTLKSTEATLMPPPPPEVIPALTALCRDLYKHISGWPGDHPKYLIGLLESAVALGRITFGVRTTCQRFRPGIDSVTRTFTLSVLSNTADDRPCQTSTDDVMLATATSPALVPAEDISNRQTARPGPIALRNCAVGDWVRLESGEVVEIELLNECRARVCPVPAGRSSALRGQARDVAPSAEVVIAVLGHRKGETVRMMESLQRSDGGKPTSP
jgi:ParB-like nuclease domain